MAHIGVKNRTDARQVLTYDAKTIYFNPGEVRLIEGVEPDFVESRMHLSHPKSKDANGVEIQSQVVQGQRLFDILSLEEALKQGARPDEDPRVIAARLEAQKKAKERAQLLSELKADLVEEGWVAPKAKSKIKEGDL